jgi:hypothetical protein
VPTTRTRTRTRASPLAGSHLGAIVFLLLLLLLLLLGTVAVRAAHIVK